MSTQLTVIVPTYRRPGDFANCLAALGRQTRCPTEVLAIIRDEDRDSRAVAARFSGLLPLRVIAPAEGGHVQALNAGLANCRTPLVAITDDDAAPHPDWLERIVSHFQDPSVGAVGGRDFAYWRGTLIDGTAEHVGRIRPYGRVLGNHHLASSLQRVQFLKGVNMSYRLEALSAFDANLAGGGAQVCNDMQVSLRAHVAGWILIWDPEVAVDHFPAERLDDDKRGAPSYVARLNAAHNQAYVLLATLPHRRTRLITFAFGLLVGSRDAPGLLFAAALLSTSSDRRRIGQRCRANVLGRCSGLRTYLRVHASWRTHTWPRSR